MAYEYIITERLDGCAVITLNRPEKLNALSFPLMSEVEDALCEYEADEAIKAAYSALKPGGELMILDLAKHKFERAHELYGDRWLGFAESDLQRWLEAAGFKKIEINVVARTFRNWNPSRLSFAKSRSSLVT